jgi:hypothetical protein
MMVFFGYCHPGAAGFLPGAEEAGADHLFGDVVEKPCRI